MQRFSSASALGETFELVGLKETISGDCGELDDHASPAWIVECVRELFVSGPKKPEHIQIALMMTPRGIPAKGLDFLKKAFAKLLESQRSKLAKDLPV